MKGKLIVIDGTDGSGKGTQTNLLVEKLRKEGHKVEIADFPRYGERSAVLAEDYLNGKFGSAKDVGAYRASIFYAADRYAASFQMKRWLDEGKIVVSNRYVSASMGHQAGKIKDKIERDKFLNWLEDLEYNIFGIPKPDTHILLFMPPQIGQKLVEKKEQRSYIEDSNKGKNKDIHEADIQHLIDAAESFKYVANKYNWNVIECAPNGKLKSIEEVHSMIWEKVKWIIE